MLHSLPRCAVNHIQRLQRQDDFVVTQAGHGYSDSRPAGSWHPGYCCAERDHHVIACVFFGEPGPGRWMRRPGCSRPAPSDRGLRLVELELIHHHDHRLQLPWPTERSAKQPGASSSACAAYTCADAAYGSVPPPHPLRRHGRALAGTTGALLLPRLAATAGNFAARLSSRACPGAHSPSGA